MGNKTGALKVAAQRLGLTLEAYTTHLLAGEKWCYRCHLWKPVAGFARDRTRSDNHKATCLQCGRVTIRKDVSGRVSAFKGRCHTPEARQKMSEDRRGNQRRSGKPCTPEQRDRISEGTKRRTPRGAAHPRFIDGRGHERANRGLSPEDIAWRTAVYARDRYTCQDCSDNRGGNLNAHHLKSWADYPELRHDVSNGVTLCEDCHDNRHYGHPRHR